MSRTKEPPIVAEPWAFASGASPTHYLPLATTSCGSLSTSDGFTKDWSKVTCRACRPDAPERRRPPSIKPSGRLAGVSMAPVHFLQRAQTSCGNARRNHRLTRDPRMVSCADCRAAMPLAAFAKRQER